MRCVRSTSTRPRSPPTANLPPPVVLPTASWPDTPIKQKACFSRRFLTADFNVNTAPSRGAAYYGILSPSHPSCFSSPSFPSPFLFIHCAYSSFSIRGSATLTPLEHPLPCFKFLQTPTSRSQLPHSLHIRQNINPRFSIGRSNLDVSHSSIPTNSLYQNFSPS